MPDHASEAPRGRILLKNGEPKTSFRSRRGSRGSAARRSRRRRAGAEIGIASIFQPVSGRDRELGHGGRDQSGSGADRLRRGPERGRVRTTATIGIGTGRCRHQLTADAGAERSGDGSPGCDGARHLRSSGNESPDEPVPHITPLIARGARSQPVPLIRARARHDREAGDGWPGSSRRSPGEAPPFGLRRQPLQGTTPPPRRSARFARLQPNVSPRLVRPPERSAGSDYATRNDVPRIARRLSHHGSVHACNK